MVTQSNIYLLQQESFSIDQQIYDRKCRGQTNHSRKKRLSYVLVTLLLVGIPDHVSALPVSYRPQMIGLNHGKVAKMICHMSIEGNNESSDENNSKRAPKGQKNKPKRRFAQAIDPIVASSSSTSSPVSKQKLSKSNRASLSQMDTNMANFMKMEADSWNKKSSNKPKQDDNMITMKDFMHQIVERENRSPVPKKKNQKDRDFHDESSSTGIDEKNYSNQPSSRRLMSKSFEKYDQNDENRGNQRNERWNQSEERADRRNVQNENRKKLSKSMMRTNMSIEELEAIMMKRWGTNSEQFTADPSEYEEKYDEDNSNDNKNKGIFFRGKAVVDPWEKEERKKQKKQRWRDNEDFYDEDDEGYEFTKSSNKKNNEYSDLISPKPIGGSGMEKKTPFFSRDLGDEKSINEGFRAKKKERATKNKESIEPTKPKPLRPPRTRNPILLDEEGNNLYLTVEKALKDAGLDSDPLLESEGDEDQLQEDDAITSFESLGISHPKVLSNLDRLSLYSPLPVQIKTIPPALSGNDVLLPTHTGSGKTLAFLLPIIENLLLATEESNGQGIQVMIMAPGRELASQIMTVTRDLIAGTGLKALLAIGGTPYQRTVTDMRKKKPDIIVGTPGRLAELVVGQPGERSGKMKLNQLKTIVLDEFDALLEYKPHREPTMATLDFLHKYTARNIQTFLCSATASDIPQTTLKQYLRDDYAVASTTDDESAKMITSSGMSKSVIHGVIHVPHQKRALDTLRKVLHTDPIPRQILIFVENARRVDVVVEKLAEMNIIAAPLHGGNGLGPNSSSKTDRAEVNKALRDGYVGIVVATELAARGIDAPLLTHVINLDLPTDASHYAHRAGRCGRGVGRPGVVLNFTTNNKERNVPKNKFAENLGIKMWTVEPRNGKLAILNEDEEEEVQRI